MTPQATRSNEGKGLLSLFSNIRISKPPVGFKFARGLIGTGGDRRLCESWDLKRHRDNSLLVQASNDRAGFTIAFGLIVITVAIPGSSFCFYLQIYWL